MLRLNNKNESFLIRKDDISYVEAVIESNINIFGNYVLNINIHYSDKICYLEYRSKDKSYLQDIKNNILNDAANNSADSKEIRNEMEILKKELEILRKLKDNEYVVKIN